QRGANQMARPLHQLSEQLQGAGAVVGMDQLEHVAARAFRRGVAKHGGGRLTGVQHGPVRVQQHDDVARVLEQRAEPLLAGGLRGERFGGLGHAVSGRGGGSFRTSQYSPSWRTASTNWPKSTGLRMYLFAPRPEPL